MLVWRSEEVEGKKRKQRRRCRWGGFEETKRDALSREATHACAVGIRQGTSLDFREISTDEGLAQMRILLISLTHPGDRPCDADVCRVPLWLCPGMDPRDAEMTEDGKNVKFLSLPQVVLCLEGGEKAFFFFARKWTPLFL